MTKETRIKTTIRIHSYVVFIVMQRTILPVAERWK